MNCNKMFLTRFIVNVVLLLLVMVMGPPDNVGWKVNSFSTTSWSWISKQQQLSSLSSSLKRFIPETSNDDKMNNDDKNERMNRREWMKSSFNSGLVSSSLLLGLLCNKIEPARATMMDNKRGIVFPSIGEIESAIPTTWEEDDNPYNDDTETKTKGSGLFGRLDNSSDDIFYQEARMGEHVDEQAVELMTSYIQNQCLSTHDKVLDIGASWTSHISPQTKIQLQLQQITGLGMNEYELQNNPVLTDYNLVDLNANPHVSLPYNSNTYDLVLCQLSIDYFIHPLQVLKEVGRVLKPGGKVVILFSNRLFLQKVSHHLFLFLHTFSSSQKILTIPYMIS